MRRFSYLPSFRAGGYLYLKIIALAIICVLSVHIGSNIYISSKPILRTRALSDPSSLLNWQSELNKRMVNELRKQIREKDKLLHYRARVIFSLRTQVADLNETSNILKSTINNLTDIVIVPNTNISNSTFSTIPYEPTAYPSSIGDDVNKQARPCCIALKRMTDILRVYMETNDDLQDQLYAYQKFNFTQHFNDIAQKERLKFLSLNCSERFLHEHQNLTKKQERLSNYQTYSKGFFYEIIPPNRDVPKQKFKHKGLHRNIDFSKAVNAAHEHILKYANINRSLIETGDAIVKYNELRGAEYKLSFIYNNERTFHVNLWKPYGDYVLTEQVFEKINRHAELINIIVPISGRTERLKSFLENIRKVLFNGTHENIFLTVVVYGDDYPIIKKSIIEFSEKIGFRNYDILKRNEPFNRGRALHDGIMRWNGYANVLLFLCDIDIKFDNSFLNRCRRYSELGKSTYIPILFSLYNPNIVFGTNKTYTEKDAYNITAATGTWRPLGYGMVCVHKPDYLRAKGFNLRINGWGGEDISLYQRFLKAGIKVIRAPDPGLYHVWHPKTCPKNLTKKQYENCIGSMARYEASQRQLGIKLLSDFETINRAT